MRPRGVTEPRELLCVREPHEREPVRLESAQYLALDLSVRTRHLPQGEVCQWRQLWRRPPLVRQIVSIPYMRFQAAAWQVFMTTRAGP